MRGWLTRRRARREKAVFDCFNGTAWVSTKAILAKQPGTLKRQTVGPLLISMARQGKIEQVAGQGLNAIWKRSHQASKG